MKCIAIDDEPLALKIISEFCQRVGDLTVETFTDPIVGMECVRTSQPDLLFLDIKMGEISGVDLAKELPKGIILIFTTAYAQFAIDGFEVNAVDFLHKPFSFVRFERAINKVREIRALQGLIKAESDDAYITVKIEYKSTNIRLSEIQYIESMDNYIKIHTLDGKPLLPQMNLKKIESMLPNDKFVRIHKSYIVPLNKIASFNNRCITLHLKSIELPVGRVFAERLKEMINNKR
ncbi:MAG: LytTR family DNA-binding domain-containing protein [Rikenellaceae bacterium]